MIISSLKVGDLRSLISLISIKSACYKQTFRQKAIVDFSSVRKYQSDFLHSVVVVNHLEKLKHILYNVKRIIKLHHILLKRWQNEKKIL